MRCTRTQTSRHVRGTRALFVQVDQGNQVIRKIVISTSVVSLLAGKAGSLGYVNGVGSNAFFSNPSTVSLNAAGTTAIVVSDSSSSPS